MLVCAPLHTSRHSAATKHVHDGWQVIQEIQAPTQLPASAAADDGVLATLAHTPAGALIPSNPDPSHPQPIRVNFQPQTAAIPDGFLADKGKDYGVRSNGLSYGWVEGGHPDGVIRNFHPLPQYDTFQQLGEPSDGWAWEIALPTGDYPVALVLGDATSTAHNESVVVQGQAFPDGFDPTTPPTYTKGRFVLVTAQVHVDAGGVLTIQSGDGAVDPTACFVEIGPQGTSFTADQVAAMQAKVDAATARTGGQPFWDKGKNETRTYVWGGPFIDDLMAFQRTTGAGTDTYYVHSGAQYSVQAVTDASGAVVESYTYDAYGRRTVAGASDGRSRIGLTTGFTGRPVDEESGLMYFRNRMYAPGMGTFVSRDPMGYVDGPSLYRTYWIPNVVDPSGFSSSWDISGTDEIIDREKRATLETPLMNVNAWVAVDASISKGSDDFALSAYSQLQQMQDGGWTTSTTGMSLQPVPGVGASDPGFVGANVTFTSDPAYAKGCCENFGFTQGASLLMIYRSRFTGEKGVTGSAQSDYRPDYGGATDVNHHGWYDAQDIGMPTKDMTDVPGTNVNSIGWSTRIPVLVMMFAKTQIRCADRFNEYPDPNKPPMATIYWMYKINFEIEQHVIGGGGPDLSMGAIILRIKSTSVRTKGQMYPGDGPATNPMAADMQAADAIRSSSRELGIWTDE